MLKSIAYIAASNPVKDSRKIVAQQLSNFLEINKHISNTQYGFRHKLSTETALATLTNKLYINMGKRKYPC